MHDDLILKIYAPYSTEKASLLARIHNRKPINIFGDNYIVVKMEEIKESESIVIPFVLQSNSEKAHHIIYARKINIIDKSTKKEPELIQGYTAEQWQEIIAGKYLCEFSDDKNYNKHNSYYDVLDGLRDKRGFHTGMIEERNLFVSKRHLILDFKYCRPSQLKGILRPIFVEPVDKESECCFIFDDSSCTNIKWSDLIRHSKHMKYVIKYIEL